MFVYIPDLPSLNFFSAHGYFGIRYGCIGEIIRNPGKRLSKQKTSIENLSYFKSNGEQDFCWNILKGVPYFA